MEKILPTNGNSLSVICFCALTLTTFAQLQLQTPDARIEAVTAQPVQEKADSLVRIVAESQGLPVVPVDKLPRYGTYWEALDPFGRVLPPMPFLPLDASAVVYQMADGQFLVDNGQATMIPQPLRRSKLPPLTPEEFVAKQVATLVGLVDQVQTAQQNAELKALAGESDEKSLDSEGGGGMSARSFLSFPDPGLRILVPTNALAVPTQFAVILTNTIPGEPYDVLTKSALNDPVWAVEVVAIFSQTNFIPVQLSRNGRTNLFVWARFAGDSTGSGIPDWWLLQYFGTTDVDPYGDADGDGWNNFQEYQNGTNPAQFNTPPPPKNVIATLDGTGANVVLTWQSGGVTPTQYGIIKNGVELTQVSGTTLTYSGIAYSVNSYYVPYGTPEPSFQIRAYYSSGSKQSAATTVAKPTLTLNGAELVRGPQGQMSLSVAAPPSGLSFVRFYWSSFGANLWFDVSATNLSNGLLLIPTNAFPQSYLIYYLPLSAKAFSTNGTFGLATYTPFFTDDEFSDADDLGVFQFVDARRQMKENLIFLLRSASATRPFRYGSDYWTWDAPYQWIDVSFPDYTAYGFRFYQPFDGLSGNYSPIAETRPTFEHFLWRNFVFNTLDVTNSRFKTGVSESGFYDDNNDYQPYFVFYPQPKYQYAGTGLESPLPLMFTNASSTWLKFSDGFFDTDLMADLGISGDPTNFAFAPSFRNFFGLPVNSIHYPSSGGFVTMTGGQSGGHLNFNIGLNILFAEVAQPQLSAVDYYFVNQTYYFNNYQYSDFPATVGPPIPIPGSPSFSSTNTSPLIVTGIGQPISLSGWAKLGIANGYNNRFAYIEQYFDQAYTIGTNGVATTNSAGVLSPYGEFLPTQPGRAALVTLPDLDTGQRGTGVVNVVKLQLDVNHDGVMDLSFAGPDNTSQANPMRFWVNNDNDANNLDSEALYTRDNDDDRILFSRDLEDFARLWFCGMPALPSSNGYSVTLSWQNIASGTNPKIKIYPAAETDGGTGYLTDNSTALSQLTFFVGQPSPGHALGEITSAQSLTFPTDYFAQAGTKHFLFEGSGIGSGQLVLTIKQGTNVLAQTSAWLDLRDVKDMFEHVHITGVTNTPPGSFLASSYKQINYVDSSSDGDTNIIVFVHGWRMGVWDYNNFSETMFKRLYWQGYRGRFASIRWDTLSVDDFKPLPLGQDYFTYNRSEFRAWESGKGVSDYLTNLKQRFPNYNLNVCAHSMGNIVMAEALKLQLAANQQNVNNYVLMQAAVPASCYDTSFTNYAPFIAAEQPPATPNTYQGYPGAINGAISGQLVNFYNANDYALATGTIINFLGISVPVSWEANQTGYKPDQPLYYYTHNNGTVCENVGPPQVFITDSRERMAFCARPRSKAVGAQAGVGGTTFTAGQIDLNASFGFFRESDEHSAQFNWPIQRVSTFYKQLGISLGVIQPSTP